MLTNICSTIIMRTNICSCDGRDTSGEYDADGFRDGETDNFIGCGEV